MKIRAKISKINNELGYGFLAGPKGLEIFFSSETTFIPQIPLDSLAVGQELYVEVTETPRGTFATTASIEAPQRNEQPSAL